MPITERKLSELRLIEEAQPRMRIDLEVVADYADLLKAGKDLPPIIVFGDVVADGFHRYLAHQSADRKTIRTVTQQGAEREAILYSCGANATHGLRRTSADKRKAVLKVLSDPEWGQWSSRRIAERCGVDHSTVDTLRNTLSAKSAR